MSNNTTDLKVRCNNPNCTCTECSCGASCRCTGCGK
jgi:hypothetical protein